MSKKKSSNKGKELSPELIEIIRVKPEDTQKLLDALPYRIKPRPENTKNPKGKMWCCYCGEFNEFIQNHPEVPLSNYYRCKKCSISIEDYYIKCHNGLWDNIKLKK